MKEWQDNNTTNKENVNKRDRNGDKAMWQNRVDERRICGHRTNTPFKGAS
jgi:hypothetical protein